MTPARVAADQGAQAPADLDRGRAVERQDDDALGRHPQHPQQIGDTMDDDFGLARARARQHEPVDAFARLHELLLDRMPERFDDLLIGLGRGRQLEQLLAAGEVLLDEPLAVPGEVRCDERQRIGDLAQPALGILVHHVDLEVALSVVALERGEVFLQEARSRPRGRAACSVIAERNTVRPLSRMSTSVSCRYSSACSSAAAGSWSCGRDLEIVCQRLQQLTRLAFDDRVGAAHTLRQLGQQRSAASPAPRTGASR